MTDLSVVIETRPALTTKELQAAFEKAGDEPFHDAITNVRMSGEAPANVAPGHIAIDLDSREGGRAIGMKTEVDWYLRAAIGSIVREITQLRVDIVPEEDDKPIMLDEKCPFCPSQKLIRGPEDMPHVAFCPMCEREV